MNDKLSHPEGPGPVKRGHPLDDAAFPFHRVVTSIFFQLFLSEIFMFFIFIFDGAISRNEKKKPNKKKKLMGNTAEKIGGIRKHSAP